MIVQVKTTNSNKAWNVNSRFRVGETVSYGGSIWVNTTGINDEPLESSSNWEKISGEGNDWVVGQNVTGQVVTDLAGNTYYVVSGTLEAADFEAYESYSANSITRQLTQV